MEFWKINGNGNDFITILAPTGGEGDEELSALARRLQNAAFQCRRLGSGDVRKRCAMHGPFRLRKGHRSGENDF